MSSAASVHLLYGFDVPAIGEAARHAISVLSYYADYQLRREIREGCGLAYTIKSFAHFFSDRGLLIVAVVCAGEDVDAVHVAVERVLQEIMCAPLSMEILNWAKQVYLTQAMIRLDELKGVMTWLGKHQLFNISRPSVEGIETALRALSLDSIANMARSVIDPDNLVISAHLSEASDFLEHRIFLGRVPVHLDLPRRQGNVDLQ